MELTVDHHRIDGATAVVEGQVLQDPDAPGLRVHLDRADLGSERERHGRIDPCQRGCDIALHGGKTSAGEGYYWLKGEALIHLEPKRVDDEQRGEDPRTAGKWMLAVSIGERGTSSSYEGLEFTPAPPR